MADNAKTVLVVSAHSADFVWRCGGAIALYAGRGYRGGDRVPVLWRARRVGQAVEAGAAVSLEQVKAERRREAEAAAAILGGEPVFFDLGDYPLRVDDDALYRLVDLYREHRPRFVLTHALEDPYNFDHPLAARMAQEARIVAQAHGHSPEQGAIGAPPLFLFEPHQPEQCNWKPEVLLDITEVFETKRRAFAAMAAQEHLWEYYTRVALQRGVQAKRNSGRDITYAEGYQRVFPLVTDHLQ